MATKKEATPKVAKEEVKEILSQVMDSDHLVTTYTDGSTESRAI